MTITENNITYEIPEIIVNLLRNAVDQAESIGQTISISDFYNALPLELQEKIKKHE